MKKGNNSVTLFNKIESFNHARQYKNWTKLIIGQSWKKIDIGQKLYKLDKVLNFVSVCRTREKNHHLFSLAACHSYAKEFFFLSQVPVMPFSSLSDLHQSFSRVAILSFEGQVYSLVVCDHFWFSLLSKPLVQYSWYPHQLCLNQTHDFLLKNFSSSFVFQKFIITDRIGNKMGVVLSCMHFLLNSDFLLPFMKLCSQEGFFQVSRPLIT